MAELNWRVRQRCDTKANWSAQNPVLYKGELALEDQGDGTFKIKIGNGSLAYNSLKYFGEDNNVGVSLLSATLPAASWAKHQNGVWKQTVSNVGIKTGLHVSIEASVEEFIKHMTDTPVTSLVPGSPVNGAVDVFAFTDTKPTTNYVVRLVFQQASVI